MSVRVRDHLIFITERSELWLLACQVIGRTLKVPGVLRVCDWSVVNLTNSRDRIHRDLSTRFLARSTFRMLH
jgi:hypothetical protein